MPRKSSHGRSTCTFVVCARNWALRPSALSPLRAWGTASIWKGSRGPWESPTIGIRHTTYLDTARDDRDRHGGDGALCDAHARDLADGVFNGQECQTCALYPTLH